MSEVTKKLLADFKVLLDDVGELVKTTSDQAGERVSELRQSLARRVEEGKGALVQREEQLVEQAGKAKSRVVTYLREGHWDRVAIYAGIGVLLGLALRCRKPGSKRSKD
jgi:ElaB/YqjD/DUF883 family membrane-anchored ribosome-binding protein